MGCASVERIATVELAGEIDPDLHSSGAKDKEEDGESGVASLGLGQLLCGF